MLPESHYLDTNHIRLHYIAYPAPDAPKLLLLHGLTANAYAFSGLVAAGLADGFALISPDLRGRGLSEHTGTHYTVEDHAKDVLGLMDALGLEQVLLGGHSFGGLLSAYLASRFPERFPKVIFLDAAVRMNRQAGEMLGPTLARLDQNFPSWEDYLAKIKAAPFSTFWEPALEDYYRHDVETKPDGSVEPRPNLAEILQVAYNVSQEPWEQYFEAVRQPALLVNGLDDYTMDMPLLPDCDAKETVALMPDCRYVAVDGNHHTMLYGPGARQTVKAIREFLAG